MNDRDTPSRVARWVSIALHPVVTVFMLIVAATARFADRDRAVPVIALTVVLAFVPIIIVMVAARRSGRWQNVDASQPKERRLLFTVALLSVLLLVGALLIWSPASNLARGAIAAGALLAVAWLLLRWIKVSLHLAFAAFSAASLSSIEPWLAVALFAALPILGWSRLRMHRHTVRELVAGALLGLMFGALLLAR